MTTVEPVSPEQSASGATGVGRRAAGWTLGVVVLAIVAWVALAVLGPDGDDAGAEQLPALSPGPAEIVIGIAVVVLLVLTVYAIAYVACWLRARNRRLH